MGSYRAERVAELVHKEVAQRLRTEVKDPRLTPISITSVEVTRDLQRAQISWMPLGGGPASTELVEAVDDVARVLRGPVGRALRLRNAPELVFVEDEHTDQALCLTALLDQLTRDREEEE
jgi:ribosome-binding factor A